MKQIALSLLLASSIALPSLVIASQEKSTRQVAGASQSAIADEIDMAEWNLRHSSVSKAIPISALDKSISTLARAREELATGNVRTARELLQRASQPLSRMEESALAGRHPDQQLQLSTTRQTLESIIEAAQRIAAEKGASDDFASAARAEIRRSDALLAAGQTQAAHHTLQVAYAAVSRRIAQLRSGDSFYIAAPAGATDAEWRDGLRRIEERREITRYIRLEARAEGLDVTPLERGAASAEALVGSAAAFAGEKRWDLALATLDRAYAEYEESWRAVGVEW